MKKMTLEHLLAEEVMPDRAQEFRQYAIDHKAVSAKDIETLLESYTGRDAGLVFRTLEYVKNHLNPELEPMVYKTAGYDEDALSYQDEINSGKSLILDMPTGYRCRYSDIKLLSVAKIKKSLAHTTIYGENLLLHYRKMGESCLPQIKLALALFEEQIKRQAKLTDRRDINLFTLDYDARAEIVWNNYAEIIAYLLYHTKETLAWGELTEAQKRLYLLSVINSQGNNQTKTHIVQNIASYTTLPELEKVEKHNLRVLKRFIVK